MTIETIKNRITELQKNPIVHAQTIDKLERILLAIS